LVIVLLGLLINLILFLISWAKHTIPLKDAFTNAMKEFKKYFKGIFKYYIPVIMIFLFQVIFFGYNKYLETSTGSGFLDSFSLSVRLIIIISPIVLQIIYYFIVDTSLAKSYYQSLQNNQFQFSWINFSQIIKLFFLSILYGILFILGLPFLMIPSLLLGYMLPFIRYPIITENKGIFESIRRGFGILKKEFWNVVFYVSIYAAMISIFNSTFNEVPYLGDLVSLFTLIIVQPIGTIFFTDFYFKIENKYLKDQATPSTSQTSSTKQVDSNYIVNYIINMESQGYSDVQIKQALMNSGYDERTINNCFQLKYNQRR
jgi:hypothetical protein